MLRKINEGAVSSDNGFSVQITGPELLEYKDENHLLEINLAYDPQKRKIYIYASNISGLDEDEKKRIIVNIKEGVRLLKGDFEVI
ncbi:MAG: hypothetical protein Q8M40_02010 [Legionella sp.]|nr:hypothetical protein [Legionella sp.]